MSNSKLVNYTRLSPNRNSPRNRKIDTITIHCLPGPLHVETIGMIFAPTTRKASSNYGVGTDGRIGLFVNEGDRSWCSSSQANDNRAVTIEVATTVDAPYTVNKATYDSLIKLCADIIKRNGMGAARWQNNKTLIGQPEKQNFTLHKWFANTACPGPYIHNNMTKITNDINKLLGASTPKPIPSKPIPPKPGLKKINTIAQEVIAGKWGNGIEREKAIIKAGYNYTDVQKSVNYILKNGKKGPQLKSTDAIAREVIAGKWGNGVDRKNRLTKAGYNPTTIQKRVNQIL